MPLSGDSLHVLANILGTGPALELSNRLTGTIPDQLSLALGLVCTGGFVDEFAADTITATTGGQGTATPLTAEVNRVTTVANPADAVMLPASVAGRTIFLTNHGANTMQVFGKGADKIDDQTNTTGVPQMVNSIVAYICHTAGNWYSIGLSTGWGGPGLQTCSFTDAMAANSGGVQSGATAITTMFSRFTTVGGAGFSSVLPACVAGMNLCIINAAAANTMNMFPAGTDQINALGASIAYQLPAGSQIVCYSTVAGQWHTIASRPSVLPAAQFVTNTTTGTFLAGQLTGADGVYYTSTAVTPGTINPRTASQMFADTPNAYVGQTWELRIGNSSGNVLTVATNSVGVTVTGTNTIAANSYRDFQCIFNTASTATMQNVGGGSI